MIFRIAFAEDHQLAARFEQGTSRSQNQVDTLLFGKTSDDAEERSARLGRQSAALLKRPLAERLAGGHCIDVIVRRNMAVGRGIPFAVIHAVYDAEQILPPLR